MGRLSQQILRSPQRRAQQAMRKADGSSLPSTKSSAHPSYTVMSARQVPHSTFFSPSPGKKQRDSGRDRKLSTPLFCSPPPPPPVQPGSPSPEVALPRLEGPSPSSEEQRCPTPIVSKRGVSPPTLLPENLSARSFQANSGGGSSPFAGGARANNSPMMRSSSSPPLYLPSGVTAPPPPLPSTYAIPSPRLRFGPHGYSLDPLPASVPPSPPPLASHSNFVSPGGGDKLHGDEDTEAGCTLLPSSSSHSCSLGQSPEKEKASPHLGVAGAETPAVAPVKEGEANRADTAPLSGMTTREDEAGGANPAPSLHVLSSRTPIPLSFFPSLQNSNNNRLNSNNSSGSAFSVSSPLPSASNFSPSPSIPVVTDLNPKPGCIIASIDGSPGTEESQVTFCSHFQELHNPFADSDPELQPKVSLLLEGGFSSSPPRRRHSEFSPLGSPNLLSSSSSRVGSLSQSSFTESKVLAPPTPRSIRRRKM